MSPRPPQSVLSDIFQFSPHVLDDLRQLRAALEDAFPAASKMREALLLVARCGTPSILSGSPDDSTLIHHETHRVAKLLGLSTDWLATPVAQWAKALGGTQPVPEQKTTNLSEPQAKLPQMKKTTARALQGHFSGIPWHEISPEKFEACLRDLIPVDRGVQERLLVLERAGSLARLSSDGSFTEETFRHEFNRLKDELSLPSIWIEAGLDDACMVLGFSRLKKHAETKRPAGAASPVSKIRPPNQGPTLPVPGERAPERYGGIPTQMDADRQQFSATRALGRPQTRQGRSSLAFLWVAAAFLLLLVIFVVSSDEQNKRSTTQVPVVSSGLGTNKPGYGTTQHFSAAAARMGQAVSRDISPHWKRNQGRMPANGIGLKAPGTSLETKTGNPEQKENGSAKTGSQPGRDSKGSLPDQPSPPRTGKRFKLKQFSDSPWDRER